MQFYNTLTRKNEIFPSNEKEITMYVCGITPYDHIHLGHARTYIAFDILKRFLISQGYKVRHIQNITDVDDKIIKRMKENNENHKMLTERFISEAKELLEKLQVIPADVYPKVTEHIPEIIAMIVKIMENGYAYETKTGVYFEVRKFKDYGKLSNQSLDKIIVGTRKEVDETKKYPEDFALWKKTNGEVIEFNSPFGYGRPGWHIECSTTANRYSNGTLDIHGGGIDLIFPHHENEIAQSESINKFPFAKFWMHAGFLTVNKEKMSKSINNFITLQDILKKYSSNAVRIFFAMTHYRSSIDYNPGQIQQAEVIAEHISNFMDRLENAIEERKNKEKKNQSLATETKNKFKNFYRFLESDLDTPNAMTYIFSIMKSVNTHLIDKTYDYTVLKYVNKEMKNVLYILGLQLDKGQDETDKKTKEEIERLIEERNKARNKGDYAIADKIRKELLKRGITVEDNRNETKWKIKYKNKKG